MAIAVVQGATLQCTCGSTPSKLTVTSQQQAKIDEKLAATIMDHAPVANIAPFGNCKVLTAAASGTPTPCVPVTPGPWTPGSATRVTIGKFPALLNTDTLACVVPGVISIVDPGQKKTTDT